MIFFFLEKIYYDLQVESQKVFVFRATVNWSFKKNTTLKKNIKR